MSAAAKSREAFARYSRAVKGNFFDPHMRSLAELYGNTACVSELETFGASCATVVDDLARANNHTVNLPRLTPYDGFGNRTEHVAFPEEYHAIGRHAYGTGIMTRYRERGGEFGSLAMHYLLSQNGEAGHCCPLACTAGLIKCLQAEVEGGSPHAELAAEWLQRLYDPDYDTHYHASQFLTEVQGGSDVGANELAATDRGDGWWELTGEKWFCSVVDAHLFLVVARPAAEEGASAGTRSLRGFVVPRSVVGLDEDGGRTPQPNNFRIRRLKDKLGTRSMASGEIDFVGALALPLSGGFKDILGRVINTSRMYNASHCTGVMQRCHKEAAEYAANRVAFGRTLLSIPAVRATVARLSCEAHGARAVSFFAAHLADTLATGGGGGEAGEQGEATDALRMLVNLNKYWTAEAALRAVHQAIDVLGGNGAIEEFSVLPRLLRDAVVAAQWEGPHSLLCAQLLKDSQRLRLHLPLFALLRRHLGPHERLEQVEQRWGEVLKLPADQASLSIRPVVDELRPVVQALLLLKEGETSAHGAARAAGEHLLATSAPAWDVLSDVSFLARVDALTTDLATAAATEAKL